MDALHIILRTGARMSDARFNSHVGTGSSRQCLAGLLDSSRVISSVVTGSKLDNFSATVLMSITGDGAVAVEARILSIFVAKCVANSSAEKRLRFRGDGGDI